MNIIIDADGSGFNIPGINMKDDVYANAISDQLWELDQQVWKTSKDGFKLDTAAWKLTTDAHKLDVNAYKLAQDMWYNNTTDTWYTADPGVTGAVKKDENSYIHVDGTAIKSIPATVTKTGVDVEGKAVNDAAASGQAITGVDASTSQAGIDSIQETVSGFSIDTDRSGIVPSGNTVDGAKINQPTSITDVGVDSTVISGATVDPLDNKWTAAGISDGDPVRFKGGVPVATPPIDTNTLYYYKTADQRLYTDAAFTNVVDVTDASGTYSLVKDPTVLKKAGHTFETGDRVSFNATAPGGANVSTTYYVNKIDADKFSLHANAADAASGANAILIDDTASTFTLDQINDTVVTLANHGYADGDEVKFKSNAPSGAAADTTYYVKSTGTNTFTLHTDAALTSAALELDSSSTEYTIEGPMTDKLTLTGHGYQGGEVVNFAGAVPTASPAVDTTTNYTVTVINPNEITLYKAGVPDPIRFDASASNFDLEGAATTSTVIKADHGLSTNDVVQFAVAPPAVSGTALAANTKYYVKSLTADSYELYRNADLATGKITFDKSTTAFNVDKFTATLEKATHGYTTGDIVEFKTASPDGTDLTTFYYVKTAAGDPTNKFTLHATSADATAGDNAILVTDTTTGTYELRRADLIFKDTHGLADGDTIQFGTSLATPNVTTAVTAGTNYYVNKVDDDHFTIHSSASDASSGINEIGFKDSVPAFNVTKNIAQVTTTAAHGLEDGDEVRLNGTPPTLPSGTLDANTSYFVHKTGDNGFSLHTSATDATNNQNAIVLNTSATNFAVDEIVSSLKLNAHGLNDGDQVQFTGTLPTSHNTTLNLTDPYYVKSLGTDSFELYTDSGLGLANKVTFSEASGAISLKSGSDSYTAYNSGHFFDADISSGNTGNLGSAQLQGYTSGQFTTTDALSNGLDTTQATAYTAGSFLASDPTGNGDLTNTNRSAVAAGTFMTINPIDSGEDANATVYESGAKISSSEDLAGFGTNLGSVRLTDIENAKSALALISASVERITMDRASLGAILSRMQYTSDRITEHKMNLSAAISRISDVDIAEEATNYARQQILVQSGTQMLGQANDIPRTILELLRR
jgi:flagellin-like hook-associated protein FlgL